MDVVTIQNIARELYLLVEEREARKIVLDFSDVRFLSSQALGVLLTLRRKADRSGAKVILCGIRPELMRVFKLTNLDQMFAFFDGTESALAQFGVAPQAEDD